MSWLSIETSSQQTSLAVGDDLTCLKEVNFTGNASTSLEPLYHQLKIELNKIEWCVIGQGPGSYNGLRVGYGFLKGLLCLNPRPVIEIHTPLVLASMAAEQMSKKQGQVLVINNARRGELYGALVELKNGLPQLQWEQVTSAAILRERTPDDLLACVTYDFSADQLGNWKSKPILNIYPSAFHAARLSIQLNLIKTCSLALIEPRYVREAAPELIKK